MQDQNEQDVSFPEGWFYIKSSSCQNVIEPQSLSVNAGTRAVASKQRFGTDADSQLWSYDTGFLINKDSGKVLDIEGGYIRTFHRTHACQNDRKPQNEAPTQLWVARPGGFIASVGCEGFVLDIKSGSTADGAQILLHAQKDADNASQQWFFEPEKFSQSSPANS